MDNTLTDKERFPAISENGWEMLKHLREHSHAPRYNFQSGDRITKEAIKRIREYETQLNAIDSFGWQHGETPDWLIAFTEKVLSDVPFYRRRGGVAEKFFELPVVNRSDLYKEPWAFAPNSQSLNDLIVYTTSGTTANSLKILSHPEVSTKYLAVLKKALSLHGVTLEGGNRVSIVLVGWQEQTLTYASVSSYLNDAGFVKINLNPKEWNTAEDRISFLEDCNTEIYTGDPIAFSELAKLDLKTKPKALVSSAMRLFPELKKELEEKFACPVVDIYSMNEARAIGVGVDEGHELLTPDLYVEILDENGKACAPLTRGEIVLSGGWNPFLPLLRYRTGDYASLDLSGDIPMLVNLEGRQPVLFYDSHGRAINNIDVTHVLKPFPLTQIQLHQNKDGSFIFKARGRELDLNAIEEALRKLFGEDAEITLQELKTLENGKTIQYTSDSFESHL
jgi:phenylacetate-CoA ligase